MKGSRRHDRRKLDLGPGSGAKLLCEAACGRLAAFQVDGVGVYCARCVDEIERRIAERVVRVLVARAAERRSTPRDFTP